ncbi:MAG: NERD domain-containing protein [Tidjanibacter sp.]|nr:NERD domain-containing protein [Tidjanibacter sp.]
MTTGDIFSLAIALTAVIAATILLILHERKKREIISTVTSLSRGESSERDLIYRLVKSGIPSSTIFHDLYIPTKRGHTQIDLVVPTNVGIFVIEVKDYSGWIFGNGNHDRWTQVLAYGREKHQFYNPIKQNAGHIEALRNTSEQLHNVPIYSIIVFYGSSILKQISNIPSNCQLVYPRSAAKLIRNIISSASPAPYTNKWEVMDILKSGVENGNNEAIRNAHLLKVQRASNGKFNSTYSYSYFHFTRFFRHRRRRFRF